MRAAHHGSKLRLQGFDLGCQLERGKQLGTLRNNGRGYGRQPGSDWRTPFTIRWSRVKVRCRSTTSPGRSTSTTSAEALKSFEGALITCPEKDRGAIVLTRLYVLRKPHKWTRMALLAPCAKFPAPRTKIPAPGLKIPCSSA
jgi:hypothetical protein